MPPSKSIIGIVVPFRKDLHLNYCRLAGSLRARRSRFGIIGVNEVNSLPFDRLAGVVYHMPLIVERQPIDELIKRGIPVIAVLSDLSGILRSELGHGSCFLVQITLRPTEPGAQLESVPQSDQATAANAPRLRLLVANDDPSNAKVVQAGLEHFDHTVSVAHSGEQALAQWARHSFDVILMDIRMAELDGIETTRRIRIMDSSDSSRTRTPIIAVTAHALYDRQTACLASVR